MIARETDPALINKIANSDGVREYIRPDGAVMDWSELATTPATRTGVIILSNGEDALSVFDIAEPGIYQGHILFAPTCRGARALETAREMLAWMFEHGAKIIVGDIPTWNLAARWFARKLGFERLPNSDADSDLVWLGAS